MSKTSRLLLLSVSFLTACAAVPKNDRLAERVAQLESRQSGQAVSGMLDRIDRLQNEIQQMRGTVDEIRHGLDRLQDRQQSLYLDLDKRLLNLEGGSSEPVSNRPPDPGGMDEPSSGPDSNQPSQPGAVDDSQTPEISEPQSSEPEIIPPESEPDQNTSTGNDGEVTDSGDQAKIYQEAFVYLNNGRYDDAITNFSGLIETYPGGEYADNAQYWLGETYYVKRDFDSARSNFSQLIDKHPDSQKVPDAMLKLGFIEYELSKWKSAREKLKSVIDRYPSSNAARLAQDRLDRMKKERH